MTDNEILKALECCTKPVGSNSCADCPLYELDNCSETMIVFALDLINRQKAEIERLKAESEKHSDEWISVNNRLPKIAGFPLLMVAVNKFGQSRVVKGFTSYEYPIEFLTNEKEYDCVWQSAWKVTHWMPLPELPKGK